MIRTIEVNVDQSTWPSSGLPEFPATFHAGTSTANINILAMLLLIGHLTTPVVASGVSLSEFWAWVRYVYAIGQGDDLRITKEFADLDAHQKTILSDDFGIGIPMCWLSNRLDLSWCCDGRYFMDRFSALAGVPAATPKKRGPSKSPDFVALDQADKFHVIECKGTQSGASYRARQMAHLLPNGTPSGAVVQKRVVTIPQPFRGQQLACGLVIGVDGGAQDTGLLVQDPEPDGMLSFSVEEAKLAQDPPLRAQLARITRAAGLEATAQLVAAPSGPTASSRRADGQFPRRREARRQEGLRVRRDRAQAEILAALDRFASGTKARFIARTTEFDLPRELQIDGTVYRHVAIKQGVHPDLARSLLDGVLEDGPMFEVAPNLRSDIGGLILRGEGPEARLEIGDTFYAEIVFS